MVDNVAITAGTGTTMATDDIGGVQYPRVKISQGADGAATDVSSAAPLNVTLANGTVPSHAVTNAGTFATQESQFVTEDAAAAANPIGPTLMAVRRDTLSTSEVSADGDNIAVKATNKGQMHVYAQLDGTQISPLGQTTKSASAPVTIASDQGYAGNVGGITTLFPVTLSLDTSAYAAGDVLADTQVLTSLFRITDGTGVLQSIQVIDQDDQKQAIDFYYLSANNSLGTENSAPSISDANAVEIVGPFSVAAADYKDLGGVSVAKISNIGQPIIAATGTANGYIAAVCNSGTPTYTASGIKLRLGILRD
jgi:hypothetical protein